MERISRYPLRIDPIDMNLLPVNFLRDFTNTHPFWSLGIDSNEYFEFEIRGKVENNTQDSIMVTTTCYICDIEVPKIYFYDHCKSKRHYINKCIAETALDRMKKHLQTKEDSPTINDICDTYFCPECVVTVPQKDQKSHENLQSHKYLSMFDNLLESFFIIYANKTINNTQNEENTTHITNLSRNDSFKLDCELNNSIHTIQNTTQKECDVKTDTLQQKVSSTPELEVDCKSLDSSNTNKSKVATVENDDTSECTSISLNKDFRVSEQLPNNIVKDGDKFKCNICYSTFNTNSLQSHIAGSRHKMNAISSVHYMLKESGNNLYCNVCGKTFENSVTSAKQHCKGANHKMNYEKILKENGIITHTRSQFYCELCDKSIPKRNEFVHIYGSKQHRMKRPSNTYCSVCDVLIPNNEVELHNSSNSHKAFLVCKKEKFISGIDITVQNTTTDTKITQDLSNNTLQKSHFCVVCQVYVPNCHKNIDMHNNGAPHRNKAQQYSEKIVVPNIQGLSAKIEPSKINNMYYCEICQKNLVNDTNIILQHNVGASHLKKLKKNDKSLDTPNSKPEEKKTEIVCKVCKVRIPNTKTNLSDHRKGKVHLNNYKLTLASEYIILKDNKHFCQPCNTDIQNPLKHIEEKNHKTKTEQHKLSLQFIDSQKHVTLEQTLNRLPLDKQTASMVVADQMVEQKPSGSVLKTNEFFPSGSGQSQIVYESVFRLDNECKKSRNHQIPLQKFLNSAMESVDLEDNQRLLKNEHTVLHKDKFCKIM